MFNRNMKSARSERWAREDESARLSTEFPDLDELKIEIVELNGDMSLQGGRYTRHIIVARAAARFEFPCAASHCEDGAYDLTHVPTAPQ